MKLLGKFIRYYRPYRSIFIADMFCALIVCAVDLAFPQAINLLTKDWFLNPPPGLPAAIALCGIGVLAVYYACQYYITSWGHIMGARMETDMRRELFDHYQRLSFSYFDRNNTGEMMSKLVSDLFDITELAHHGPENLLIAGVKVIGAFVILLTINVKLTLILMAVTAAMVIFSYFQNRKMRAVFSDNRKKVAAVNAGIQDSLAGIRVVKSFANEKVEQGKFDRCNIAYLESKNQSYRIMGRFHAGNSMLQGVLYLVILLVGGYAIGQKTLPPAELAIFALYIGVFLMPLNMLLLFTEMFQRGFSGFRRFVEVLETAPDVADRPGAKPLNGAVTKIEYQQVGFSYDGKNPILTDITFELTPGKTVALVGASGGGKTTICSLLPRFYDVTSGVISINGEDIRNFTAESLRRRIGIVQQEVHVFSGTLRENILYGRPDATEEELIEAAKRASIHDFVLSLPDGYDSTVGERGVRLSGGQKQRIAIARVFLKNPPVLIMDEATSALDNESERKIQKALAELSRGRATLVIAHRLSTIRGADEIIVIDNGKIVERGAHDTLLSRDGIYTRYHSMQTGE